MYGDASRLALEQRQLKAEVKHVPTEVRWEHVPRRAFSGKFDNVLLTLTLCPGARGHDAIVVGWRNPVRDHDAAASACEQQMFEVDSLRRAFVEKNRTYKNWETAWLLMNDRPEELEEYLLLRPKMKDFRERVALMENTEEKVQAEQQWRRYHELKLRCELRNLLAKGKLMMDKEVLPPMLRVFAYMCLPALKRALDEVAGTVKKSLFKDVEVKCEERISVKKSKRMVAKMVNEIAEEEANKNAKDERWQPISASVRDALRATLVCPDQEAMYMVYEELKNPNGKFTLRKVKNKLEKGKVPFNLHAVYEFQPSPASVSILVEVQIKIKEIEDKCGAQHKFYEISRATGSADLFKPEVEAHDEQTYDEQHMEKIKQHKSERFMLSRSNVATSRNLGERDLILVERESKARKWGGWRLMRFISKRRGRSETVHPDQPPKAPPVRRAVQDEEEDDSDSYPISYP